MNRISELNDRLSTWHGVRAELWDDDCVAFNSLSSPVAQSSGPCAVLYMYNCDLVSFSSGWKQAEIAVSQSSDEQLYASSARSFERGSRSSRADRLVGARKFLNRLAIQQARAMN